MANQGDTAAATDSEGRDRLEQTHRLISRAAGNLACPLLPNKTELLLLQYYCYIFLSVALRICVSAVQTFYCVKLTN